MPLSLTSNTQRFGFKALIERIKERVRKTRGPLVPPVTLEYRHVFVMPTKFGVCFGFLLVVMLLGGLNFNNNMALMLVFLLGAMTQMTSLLAYRNLAGLRVDSVLSGALFCGENARFKVVVSNPGKHKRYTLSAGFKQAQDCRDFEPAERGSFTLQLPSLKRGWMAMPVFRLETCFPLGLFKAWSWIFPNTRCLVYPEVAKTFPPLPISGQGESGQAKKGDGEQVHGLRKYQQGDSRHRIAWRASARHDKMYSLEMEIPTDKSCELNWDLLRGYDAESRLSVLTAWVLEADRRQVTYSLHTPLETVVSGQGAAQRVRCLEMLALYPA